MSDGPVESARAYYRALDDHDYDALAALLAEGFVHDRPDMTLEGADRFVTFMREERPQKDTEHRVDAVFSQRGGTDVVVRGRLLAADGSQITGFVDVFALSGERIQRLETYAR